MSALNGPNGKSPATQPRWWESDPARLEFELQALRDAGIPFERDEQSFADGVARLILRPQLEGVPELLHVTFPDLYPYFRFEIDAPTVSLLHHQQPFGKNLCLLGRSTDLWYARYSVAEFVRDQVPKVMRAGADPRVMATTAASNSGGQSAEWQGNEAECAPQLAAELEEEAQAEPYSTYYTYWPAMLVIDGGWTIPAAVTGGTLSIGIVGWSPTQGDRPQPLLHGVILTVSDDAGRVHAAASEGVRSLFSLESGRETMTGRWQRRASPPATTDPREVFDDIRTGDHRRAELRPYTVMGNGPRVSVYGALFPEEVGHRHTESRGWVFAVRVQSPANASANGQQVNPQSRRRPPDKIAPPHFYYLARAGRGARLDLLARTPELAPLAGHAIAVVGLGCLGGPSALEFARAGVRALRLLDGDIVDPATTGRWPSGLSAAGRHKVAHIGNTIRTDYPHVEVEAFVRFLGGTRTARDPDSGERLTSDLDILAQMTRDVSLVYNASAEFGVQYFLSEYARSRGLTYVGVAATAGGWGGRVLRIRPGVTEGCWSCWQAARADGSAPEAAADPNGFLQPEGCANPTYSGANFDLLQVAMQGVRLAVSTLSDGAAGSYPSADWDVALMSFRDAEGKLIPQVVTTSTLTRHPSCPVCAVRAA